MASPETAFLSCRSDTRSGKLPEHFRSDYGCSELGQTDHPPALKHHAMSQKRHPGSSNVFLAPIPGHTNHQPRRISHTSWRWPLLEMAIFRCRWHSHGKPEPNTQHRRAKRGLVAPHVHTFP
jgi:hypothetical protein